MNWKILLAAVLALATRGASAADSLDPCRDPDSSGCVWSEFGAPSLAQAQRAGEEVIRVDAYAQAGPWLSVMAEFRHIPGFGTLLTVHNSRRPSMGRIIEQVPETAWLAARRDLMTFNDRLTAVRLQKANETICIDGISLDADWLLDGKIGHIDGYQCEAGLVIDFTETMRKLVVNNIPYCALTGGDDLHICMLLDGDKYEAAWGIATFRQIADKPCAAGEADSLLPALAPDAQMVMNDVPVAHGARAVAAQWRALVCGRDIRLDGPNFDFAYGYPNGIGSVTSSLTIERDTPLPELRYSCTGRCDGWMSQEWRMVGGKPRLDKWMLGGFTPARE